MSILIYLFRTIFFISKVLGFIEKIHQFKKINHLHIIQLFSKNLLPQCKESQKKHNDSHLKNGFGCFRPMNINY
jgi:hypothetical protein